MARGNTDIELEDVEVQDRHGGGFCDFSCIATLPDGRRFAASISGDDHEYAWDTLELHEELDPIQTILSE